jgi:hypothetical protein
MHQSSNGELGVSRLASPRLQQQTPMEGDSDAHVPKEVCGTGEIDGQVYVCCHPNPDPNVPECDALRQRVFDECYETSEKDDRALDYLLGKGRLGELSLPQALQRQGILHVHRDRVNG